MENLSKEDKKKLFMALVNQYTNRFDLGNAYHQREGDAMYEAGYWDDNWKIKNNGILGLHYNGITEEGKKVVCLTVGGGLDESRAGIRGGNLIKQFDNDTQLDEFLDRFFNMNNMEAINEFAPDSKVFQEEEQYDGCFTNDIPLEYLYMLDCLDEELGKNLVERYVSISEYTGGEVYPGSKIELVCGYDNIELYLTEKVDEYSYKHTTANYNYNEFGSANMEVIEDEIKGSDKLVKICQKAIKDFPQVYQELRNGTYNKDKFLSLEAPIQQEEKKLEEPNFEINEFGEIIRKNNNKTPLQQKEDELYSLEEEEKKISEAEALIKKEMDKKGKDIGE